MPTIRVVRSTIVDAPIERVWAVLRDFNSHGAWHPAVGESVIEGDEPADRAGCVRNFFLKDGNHIREQLLALSDTDHLSTYCILDATLPMKRYVATARLSRVTDGERTFWHWESSFEVPAGREAEFAGLVGDGVYAGGFEGLRAFLRRGGDQGLWRLGQATEARPPAVVATGASLTAHATVVTAFGDASRLQHRSLNVAPPGPGEVRIRQSAVGVNYIDVYIRSGLLPMIDPPAACGMEAAGTVESVGEGVAHLIAGDRVAYACVPPGAYASVRNVAAAQCVVLPDELDFETAAALMLKGMSAEVLLHRVARIRPGTVVLVHAAAGGLGLLLCQWAHALGARVIGTVSDDEKARTARSHGCALTVVTRDYRFADAVLAATGGVGAEVVFDGLGAQAVQENLRSLAPTGHWISLGQASGGLDHLPLAALSERSLTFSRPVLFQYTAARSALEQIAANTFEAWRNGTIRVRIGQRFALADAAKAHAELEARRTQGATVLLP